MTGNEYQELAMRTNDHKCTQRLEHTIKFVDLGNTIGKMHNQKNTDTGGIFNACLGLSGEVGEFNDMVKKWVFHEKELDVDHVKKELGNIAWYLAIACESFGWNLDEILQINVDKLKARYPEGFDVERANHRAEDDV